MGDGVLQNLMGMLEGVVLGEGRDTRGWRSEEGGEFTMNSCYEVLERLFLVDNNMPVTLEKLSCVKGVGICLDFVTGSYSDKSKLSY